jgi:putative component of toxin-antitoxin plasmid stabilization module
MGYNPCMIAIRETETFSLWLRALRDGKAKATIAARVRRLAFGNFGDVRPAGEISVNCGGDKSTQSRDIESAKRLAKETE